MLTKCMVVISARRVERCIGCSGRSCPCCGGLGIHPSAGAKNARENIVPGFVANQRAWAKPIKANRNLFRPVR